ncbi:hypothetical protein E2C01_004561 [Portunus trituberculatus]|uniref:Uncharacterized protein n=1 Tax=Portunus trituberculatus TaxID=210409 RepID=A0A5B7CQ17_PORTR|nr:hypothetical protein [Portunus trituberculatus]
MAEMDGDQATTSLLFNVPADSWREGRARRWGGRLAPPGAGSRTPTRTCGNYTARGITGSSPYIPPAAVPRVTINCRLLILQNLHFYRAYN